MKVLVFGATGMVGYGVVRECLLASDVQRITTIGRTPTGINDPKLDEIVHKDFANYTSVEDQLSGYDACFFCLGVSSSGMSEADYERVTYGIAMAAAETLVRLNPHMTFVFVSGTGSDSTEKGKVMWARIKGKTENALLRMPFKDVYVCRPGIIEPVHGARSKTAAYRFFYTLSKPVLPWLRRAMPGYILTTEQIGLAMLVLARRGSEKRVLESKDIHALVAG
jgi:uncharacterized protein YbjT (DUF2867 family)